MSKSLKIVGAALTGSLALAALSAPAEATVTGGASPSDAAHCGWTPGNNSHAVGKYNAYVYIYTGQYTDCNVKAKTGWADAASIGCFVISNGETWYFASDVAVGITGWTPASQLGTIFSVMHC
ncbi:hypothetical protein [Actinoallomurus sp. NPDC052274]|uniref:hypothetical protein n=1 Tax=Actinoallomurus sp. NPDC052274 TaxID=3155420 RepID=UPI003417D589